MSSGFFYAFMRLVEASVLTTMSTHNWNRIAVASQQWEAQRELRPDDLPLTLYRDANAWCPFSHRVWFWMEQLELRFETEKVHLGGDPREPAKSQPYLRVSPRGTCPALRAGDEIVLESLDILIRLEREFPNLPLGRQTGDAYVSELLHSSGAFDTDCDEWLHNTRPEREGGLRERAMDKLAWLEATLAREDGPFLLEGSAPSIVDAAFVGFLTRLDHNYRFFKSFDVRQPAAGMPRLSAWLSAIEATPGGAATKQDAYFEQRIYQAHPARRAAAEPCMGLHPTAHGVGEAAEHKTPPLPTAPLQPGRAAALEAASRLCSNREAVSGFLLRKRREAERVAAGSRGSAPTQHWKASGQRRPVKGGSWSADAPPPHAAEVAHAAAATDAALLGLASVLCGVCSTDEAVVPLGGAEAFAANPVAELGGLVGTPRDMSSAAAAQLRSAIIAMHGS